MVKCPACGAEVTDPSLGFCTACGAYLSAQGKAPAPEPAVPSDPVEEGAWMASAGRIAEATAAWKKRLYAEPRVSDAVYERMLSSLTEGMLNYPVSAQSFHAAGFADIDMMIRDRELIPDLMKRLSSSLGVCKIQNGVLGLAHPYMFLLIEAFSAYTDIRELRDLCSEAAVALGNMIETAQGLPNAMPGKKPEPLRCLNAYLSFTESLRNEAAKVSSSLPSERLDALADEWSGPAAPPYIIHVRAAFLLTLRSLTAGRFGTSHLLKRRDGLLRTFGEEYSEGTKKKST